MVAVVSQARPVLIDPVGHYMTRVEGELQITNISFYTSESERGT